MARDISGVIDSVTLTEEDIITRHSGVWIVMFKKSELIGDRIPVIGDMINCTRQGSQVEKIFINNKMIVDRSSEKL